MPTVGVLFGLGAMAVALVLASAGHGAAGIAVAVIGTLVAVLATVVGAVRGER
jgi:hypothetical protein